MTILRLCIIEKEKKIPLKIYNNNNNIALINCVKLKRQKNINFS